DVVLLGRELVPPFLLGGGDVVSAHAAPSRVGAERYAVHDSTPSAATCLRAQASWLPGIALTVIGAVGSRAARKGSRGRSSTRRSTSSTTATSSSCEGRPVGPVAQRLCAPHRACTKIARLRGQGQS